MSNKDSSFEEFKNVLRNKNADLNRLRTTVFGIIEGECESRSINTLPIQSRIKTEKSCLDKLRAKNYSNPFKEMTDIVGFRIIVYLESDVNKIEKSLRDCFDVDKENSINKRAPKSVDSVGYRSLHLICSLGKSRKELREYSGLCDLKFEIQIRTILEHAWAEIEHKQNYKSERALPKHLQRRLMVVAGTLELLDRELADISKLSEEYSKKILDGDSSVRQDPISRLAISAAISEYGKKNNIFIDPRYNDEKNMVEPIIELTNFGIKTLEDLENLLAELPINKLAKGYETTTIGFIRDLMISIDFEKYFRKCYYGQFPIFSDTFWELAEIIDLQELKGLVEELGYEVYWNESENG